MKNVYCLSTFMGIAVAISFFVILVFIVDIKTAFLLSVATGIMAFILLSLCLVIYGKAMDKKYTEIEKNIKSPIIHKANGNFQIGAGIVKNGYIYFCENGIFCVCLEEKPYAIGEIPKEDISSIRCDDFELSIITNDNRQVLIRLSNPKGIIAILREKGWEI